MRRITVVACLLAAALPSWVRAEPRPIGDTVLFAPVPAPGAPEGITVLGDVVYVATHATVRGNGGSGPSKLFKYNRITGAPIGEIVIAGQNVDATHGLLGIARDADDRLYVLDRNPARVLRIDPVTGIQETYATFPDLKPCATTAPPCSPTALDEPPFPDYPAFDAAGNLYVSDLQAATIYRVPPGGGPAQIWFQDARLDGVFGPNGVAVRTEQGKLYFAVSLSQQAETPGAGLILTLPLVAAPGPADLGVFHRFALPADGPDGIAFGASGKLYTALAGSNQMAVIRPDGTEEARWPSAADNALMDPRYDLPASLAFDGDGSILLTNQSFFAGIESNMVVFDVWVDDTAWPLEQPVIP